VSRLHSEGRVGREHLFRFQPKRKAFCDLLLRFRSADLLQCRFAVSPLNETADALRSLARPGAAAYHLPWQRQARELVPGLGIEPLLAILAMHGYQPDFISPAPDSPFTEIGAELDRVRATSPEKVSAELAECLGPEWDTISGTAARRRCATCSRTCCGGPGRRL
jgi:hypothetical protein